MTSAGLSQIGTHPTLANGVRSLPDSSRTLGRVEQQRCLDAQRSRALEILDSRSRLEELMRINQSQLRLDLTYGTPNFQSPCNLKNYEPENGSPDHILSAYANGGGNNYALHKGLAPSQTLVSAPAPIASTPPGQKSSSTSLMGDRGTAKTPAKSGLSNNTSGVADIVKQPAKKDNAKNSTLLVPEPIEQNKETKVIPDVQPRVEAAKVEAAKLPKEIIMVGPKKSSEKVEANQTTVVPPSSILPKPAEQGAARQGPDHVSNGLSDTLNKNTVKASALSGVQHPASTPTAGASTNATSGAVKPKNKRAFKA